jgi:hypothetical protein
VGRDKEKVKSKKAKATRQFPFLPFTFCLDPSPNPFGSGYARLGRSTSSRAQRYRHSAELLKARRSESSAVETRHALLLSELAGCAAVLPHERAVEMAAVNEPRLVSDCLNRQVCGEQAVSAESETGSEAESRKADTHGAPEDHLEPG